VAKIKGLTLIHSAVPCLPVFPFLPATCFSLPPAT
jgi:hypothetical protein